jgi:hypothetical protein
MYAFSRDGAIPGSKFLHNVEHRWRSHIRTGSSFHRDLTLPNRKRRGLLFAFVLVRFACTLSSILGFRSLGSSVALSTYTVRSSPLSTLYFLRYATGLPNYPSPFHELSHHTNSHRPLRHLRGSMLTMTILRLRAQSCQFSNAQSRLITRPSPSGLSLVLIYILGFWAISARRWFAESIRQVAGGEVQLVPLRTRSWSNSVMASTRCYQRACGRISAVLIPLVEIGRQMKILF